MPTPIYPSWNDKEYDLLKKMTENTALIADYEIGDVASVAGTAGNVLVNGGTAAATGAITLSLPSAIRVADGTLSAPVFSFSADSDTGLFRAASGSVAYASNGIRTFAFPTVTGSSGQFLTTDGAGNITWGTGSGTLPSQTGNAGKLLTTDGVNASWSSTLAGNLTVAGGTARFQDPTNSYGVTITTAAAKTLVETLFGGSSLGIRVGGSGSDSLTIASTGATIRDNLTVSGTTGVTATDLTLGSSGPSVKSTLSARAPRQGLVFDGSTNGYATFTLGTAIGTADVTVSGWARATGADGEIALTGSSSAGALTIRRTGGVWQITNSIVANVGSFTGALPSGNFCWTYTRATVSGISTGTFYINGISLGTITDATNYSGTAYELGAYQGIRIWNGPISGALIYNRALSASEVVALYEAGAPAGADYNSASNTALAGSDISTWSTGGTATIVAGVGTVGTGGNWIFKAGLLTRGKKYRIVATTVTGSVVVFDSGASLTSGVPVEFTSTNGAGTLILNSNSTGTVSGVSVYPVGLLLAPDAAQAGGGLVWYDTSGNAANITLPASGVSWNVPTSGRWGGSLTVAAGGNASLKFAGASNVGTLSFLDGASTSAQTAVVETYSFQVKTNGTSALTIGATQDATFTGYVLNRVNAKGIYTGTSDNCGFTWTGTNGEFSTASGSIILKSAGTTALTLDSSQNATFAGNVTVNGTGTQSFKGTIALKAAAVGDGITLRESYAGNSLLFSVLQNSGDGTGATIAGADGAGSTTFSVNTQTGAATFSGSIAIGNTVQTAAGVASTHKVTISIGGTTYYLLATNV